MSRNLRLSDALRPQDIVSANNFLCHMPPMMAERYLRNIARWHMRMIIVEQE